MARKYDGTKEMYNIQLMQSSNIQPTARREGT
jgi:hypothetical protein